MKKSKRDRTAEIRFFGRPLKGPKRTPKRRALIRLGFGSRTRPRRRFTKAEKQLVEQGRRFWGYRRDMKRPPGRYKRWKASRKPRREPVAKQEAE